MKYLIIALTLVTSAAVAQEYIPLFVHDNSKPILVLGAGGCLRGPLKVYARDGTTVQFQLDHGTDYPAGCSK